MAMLFFYVQMIGNTIGWAMIATASLIALRKHRCAALYVQMVGAGMILVASVVNHLSLTAVNMKTGRIEPAWIWRAQEAMYGVGVLVFALAYLWFWASNRTTISN
jgi:hypothetical protein